LRNLAELCPVIATQPNNLLSPLPVSSLIHFILAQSPMRLQGERLVQREPANNQTNSYADLQPKRLSLKILQPSCRLISSRGGGDFVE